MLNCQVKVGQILSVLIVCCTLAVQSSQVTLQNVTTRSTSSPAEWSDPLADGLWSSLLEEWTLSNKNTPPRGREARIIQTVPAPQFFTSNPQQSSQRYIPTSESYNRRTGDVEQDINSRQYGDMKVTASPIDYGNYRQYQPTQANVQPQRQNQFNSPREVSETDLYLLGAIEKLVYRVDYMEKRLKRTEQLVYYLMSGNKQKPEENPCTADFKRVGESCYRFGLERVDWKTAATKCKAFGGNLAEFDKLDKFYDVLAHTLNDTKLRGHDFWIGGLNPGLLWIWSTSAKPVNPNANLTSLSNKTESITKVPVKVLNQTNAKNETTLTTKFPEIQGDGRCLRFSYNPSTFSYGYTGHDCSAKQNFICVIVDKSSENEIKRIAKSLKLEN